MPVLFDLFKIKDKRKTGGSGVAGSRDAQRDPYWPYRAALALDTKGKYQAQPPYAHWI